MNHQTEFYSDLTVFAQKINDMGGKAYIVGGYVRDSILGKSSHDIDIMVTGIEKSEFEPSFQSAYETGKQFPVYRMDIGGEEMEIAFARMEKKTGSGHNGFDVDASKSITVEEDLFRRDLTINAMAKDILTGKIIDPYGGVKDAKNGVIRAVSDHFGEDPLRALRASRQSASFGFKIDEGTFKKMNECKEELKDVPYERVFEEFKKAMATDQPSKFFRNLKEADILDVTFPEVNRLIGQTQPAKWHPEGDAFEHTMQVLDNVSSNTKSLEARVSALYHDIGKGLTPKELLPKHIGHDKRGVEIIEELPDAFTKHLKKTASFIAKHHMKVIHMKKGKKIISLYEEMKRKNISMDVFCEVVNADEGTVPWFLDKDIMNSTLDTKASLSPDMSIEQIKASVLEARIRKLKEFVPR